MIDLVLRPNEFTSFTSFYLEQFWRKFFNISYYDPTKTYDKNRTLFAVWWQTVDSDPWPAHMRDLGYKVVVDNIWERQKFRTDYHWIEHKYSMRWNESLWWESLGYADYVPQRNLEYLAFMQMRLAKPERDRIHNELGQFLDRMLWSYLAKNKTLADDTTDELSGQRYMHPNWYNKTYCSLVVETYVNGGLHASEKTYKPIAYYHPFMTISVPGTLAFLKNAGFETFDNLFDESYDNIHNLDLRLDIIKSNLESIRLDKSYDKLTLDKIEYNHNKFFNKQETLTSMEQEIVNPLLEYAEA